MVIDTIDNYRLYTGMHKNFNLAFEYLLKTDLKSLADGKYEIDGNQVFGIVQQYHTKKISACRLEGHKKYIDIQFMISGSEKMGFTKLNKQPVAEDLPEKDLTFYDGTCYYNLVDEGMFTIFYPTDLHMPALEVNETLLVKKIVIKVAL